MSDPQYCNVLTKLLGTCAVKQVGKKNATQPDKHGFLPTTYERTQLTYDEAVKFAESMKIIRKRIAEANMARTSMLSAFQKQGYASDNYIFTYSCRYSHVLSLPHDLKPKEAMCAFHKPELLQNESHHLLVSVTILLFQLSILERLC